LCVIFQRSPGSVVEADKKKRLPPASSAIPGAFAVLTEIDGLTPANRKIITARRDTFDHQFRTYVAAGIADSSIRSVDPKLTVFYFMGAVNWMTRWFNPQGAFNSQQIAEQFTDFLAEAIRAR
jgi:hypothetical protein